MILRGSRSVATEKEPTSPGMPSFGWQLSNAQIAAVVTYIRNAWGSGASAVTADDVRKARTDLQARTD
jgi:mono/diheme cytochrome c family protein